MSRPHNLLYHIGLGPVYSCSYIIKRALFCRAGVDHTPAGVSTGPQDIPLGACCSAARGETCPSISSCTAEEMGCYFTLIGMVVDRFYSLFLAKDKRKSTRFRRDSLDKRGMLTRMDSFSAMSDSKVKKLDMADTECTDALARSVHASPRTMCSAACLFVPLLKRLVGSCEEFKRV